VADPIATVPAPQEIAPPLSPSVPSGDTIPLVDRDGQVHQVPTAHAAQAVQSGNFGWLHGSSVPIVDPSTGLVKQVPSTEASKYLTSSGARIASGSEAAAQEHEARYGGIGGSLAAGGEGLARGLTAGLSDPLAVEAARTFGGEAAGEKTREHLAQIQATNPGISMGAELTGAIAPMFFGDEAGVADIIGSIPRGVDAAGGLAGQFASKLVGTEAASLLGRSGQKAIQGAARAIVEGGLWGAGSEVSASTLENRELTAESVMASAGHGALLAGALGGALGGLEPLGGHLMSQIREAAPFEGVLSDAADEQYIRALSPNKKSLIEQMKDRFGGEDATKRIADRIRTEGIVQAGDNIENIAQKSQKAEAAAVENLSGTVDKLGASGVRLQDAIDALEARASQFDQQLGYHSAAAAVRDTAENLRSIYPEGTPAISRTNRITEDGVKNIGERFGFGVRFGDDTAKTMNKVFSDAPPDAEGWARVWSVPDEGIEVRPTRFGDEDGKLAVNANIYKDGSHVGDLELTFSKAKNGELHVKHDVMELLPEAQQQGIGKALNEHAMNTYQDLGVHQVNLDAGMSGGRIAQARYGFSWPAEEGESYRRKFDQFLKARGVDAREAANLSTAALQGAGAVSDVEVNGQRVGREFLNTANWRGSKRLQPKMQMSGVEIPIKELLAQRRRLEGTINWQTDSVVASGRKAAGRTLEDAIMSAGDKASKASGDKTWLAEYKAAKARYSETRFINDVATDSAGAKLRNRLASPSDYGAMAMGAMVGGEGGHPLGGGLSGMLMGGVHHQVRQRGNATLAVLLDKLGTLGGLSETHAAQMSSLDSAITRALTRGGAHESAVKRGDFGARRFEKEAERIQSLAASPSAVDKHLTSQTMPIANHAPEIGAAVKAKTSAAVKYLSNQLPASFKEPPAPSLTPNAAKKSASNAEMTDFLRKVDAVEMGPDEIFRKVM